MKIKIVCAVCGKVFEVTEYRALTAKYCSPKCQYASKSRVEAIASKNRERGFTKPCIVCGKVFKVPPSKAEELKCCSPKCSKERRATMSKSLGVEKTCIVCGKVFKVQRYRAGTATTCSRSCSNSNPKRVSKILETKDVFDTQCKTNITLEHIQQVLSKDNYTLLSTEYTNTLQHLEVSCSNNHKYQTRWKYIQRGIRCPICSQMVSQVEKNLLKAILGKTPNIQVVENDRKILGGKELDLYFPEQKVAVEFCGLYWHKQKEPSYHRSKLDICNILGIRLITIFEDEYREKPDVVLSRVLQALGQTNTTVYARNTEIREITSKEANEFYAKYHLQGKTKSKTSFGLFYNEELIQAITLGSLARAHTAVNTLELKRLANKEGISIVGGASKLFKKCIAYAELNSYSKVRSYNDLRYGNYTNNVYEKLGFTKIAETKYTPHYVTPDNMYRIRNQALRKTPEERLTGKTEKALRTEQGYGIIYDCGHQTWDYIIGVTYV